MAGSRWPGPYGRPYGRLSNGLELLGALPGVTFGTSQSWPTMVRQGSQVCCASVGQIRDHLDIWPAIGWPPWPGTATGHACGARPAIAGHWHIDSV